jgi:hypothetical protein
MQCVRSRLAALQLAVLALTFLATLASADIPQKINYQGRLSDISTGEPQEGSHEMIFSIYDAAEDGTQLWTETLTVQVSSSGVFSAVLGGINPIEIAFDGPVWLQVEVGGETLAPRREMVSVPYAFSAMESGHSASSDSLGGYGADAFSDTGHVHDDRYVPGDSLGVPGSLNSGANPVDWTRLKNVPAGFADGTDDAGGTAGGGWIDDGTVVRLEDAADSVGIGTGLPGEKLDVAGTVRVEGFSMPDDSVFGHVLTADTSGTGSWQAPVADGHSLDDVTGSLEDVVYVDDSGDVGVGTADPTHRLHVRDDSNSQTGIMIENLSTGPSSGERISFKDENGSTTGIYTTDPDDPASPNALVIFNNRTGGDIRFGTGGGGEYLRLRDGKMAVGYVDPVERLTVDGTAQVNGFKLPTGAAAGYLLTSDGDGLGTWQPAPGGDGHSLDGMGGTPGDAVYVDATGNVGVGTTSPEGRLHLFMHGNSTNKMIIENPNVGESSGESLIFADENGEAAGITLTDDGFAPRPRNMQIFNDRPLGNLSFSTNGARRMVIGSNGYMGIGTTNPMQKLHVVGDPLCWVRIDAEGTNGTAGLALSNDGNAWEIDVKGDLGDALVIRDNTPGVNRVVINDDGDVGFNTSAPANPFHLHKPSSSSCYAQITNAATGTTNLDGLQLGVGGSEEGYLMNREDAPLHIGTFGETYMTVDPDGRVGIGTEGPAANMHVHQDGYSTCWSMMTTGSTGSGFNDGLRWGIDLSGNAYIRNSENTFLSFLTNGTERMWIAANGRVGIGESVPTDLLTLKGYDPYIDMNTTHDKTGFRLQQNGSVKWEVAWNEGSAYMYFWSGGGAGTSVVVEDATGDMGVGTSGPTSKVHINGANGYSQLRLQDSYTPTGTSDTNGNVGDLAWDNNYIYVKTGGGWKRAALSTF